MSNAAPTENAAGGAEATGCAAPSVSGTRRVIATMTRMTCAERGRCDMQTLVVVKAVRPPDRLVVALTSCVSVAAAHDRTRRRRLQTPVRRRLMVAAITAAADEDLQFTAVFRKVREGYIGFVEELPGENTLGATLEEARANLREV